MIEKRAIEKYIGLLIIGCVVGSVFSVAVSSILLGAAYFLVGVRAITNKSLGLQSPGFGVPLLVFLGTIAISTLASADPVWSLPYLARVLKLCFVFPLFTFLDRRQIEWTLKGLLAAMAASAVYALVQYFWFLDVSLLNRARGFMSHWMTFSGQMMIGVVALAGWMLLARQSEGRNRFGPAFWGWLLLLALLGTALVVTLTRSAWIGAFLGIFLLLALRGLKWMTVALALLVLGFSLLPHHFRNRVYAGFDPNDGTTQGRIELLKLGARIVQEHPWTGVGPRMMPRLSSEYQAAGRDMSVYMHLHNTPLQIAAEMGLPALLAWLGLWFFLGRDLIRMGLRRDPDRFVHYLTLNALALSLAFLAAGLLENNFGDSELITLLLFFVTAPYVVRKSNPSADA